MNWEPFLLCQPGQRAPAPRSMETVEGIGDRLRAAAFAEIQAREAFLWASRRFTDAPEALRRAWQGLAREEEKHLGWLLGRMHELGIGVRERPVSDFLWRSFTACESAPQFAKYMASAEERGRIAGERFFEALNNRDPVSAGIFKKIAEEEKSHIELARRFYPGR